MAVGAQTIVVNQLLDPKLMLGSKTFWMNIGFGVASLFWGEIQNSLTTGQALDIVAVSNTAMRYVTNRPVKAPLGSVFGGGN
jgi:hypothetical protein